MFCTLDIFLHLNKAFLYLQCWNSNFSDLVWLWCDSHLTQCCENKAGTSWSNLWIVRFCFLLPGMRFPACFLFCFVLFDNIGFHKDSKSSYWFLWTPWRLLHCGVDKFTVEFTFHATLMFLLSSLVYKLWTGVGKQPLAKMFPALIFE